MGKLEEASRKRKKKKDIQNAVLAVIAVTGIVAFAAVAGNALQLLDYLPNEKYNLKYRAKNAAGRLVAKKYAVWVERGGKKYLRVTPAGRKVLAFEQAKVAFGNQKKKWDGRWRMVAFDIPERRRAIRSRLRAVMQEIGFVRLQDSVWVYPYDCEDFIALFKAELKIGKDVLYAIADTIEHDKGLRRQFNLPEV
ncbi:MAG: CRISPR-associated endonuclease Cas2 [Candidatus Parcubacteria bacterium]|nr:CRISPR-associated endonuclease Cas2 [Candidatus Parcubacteria bacterium]